MSIIDHPSVYFQLKIKVKQILVHSINNKAIKQFDILITNTTIIDVINKQILLNQDIGILDGKINKISDSLPRKDLLNIADQTIDGTYYIALPGFINTHTHLWQHISKSLAPKDSLQTWIKIYKPIHYLTQGELFEVVLAASCEALLSGITTVSDYASLAFNDYGFEANADSMSKAGLNGVLVWNNPSIFLHDEIKLKELQRLEKKYTNFDLWMGFGPLSFYPIPQVYSGIVIAKQLNMYSTEHTMENIQEQRDFYDNTVNYLQQHMLPNATDQAFLYSLTNLSRPSNVDAYEQLLRTAKQILEFDEILQNDTSYKKLTDAEKKTLTDLEHGYDRRISPLLLLEYFDILKNHLAIHGVWLQNEDIGILTRHSMPVSHNPESNMYLTSGIAPIDSYLRNNILITVGTDGAASNDGINFFSAMKQMWNVYKIALMNTEISKQIDEWNIIQAATINGAKALKIDDKTGSITVGKQADLSLIAIDELGVSPLRPNTIIPLLIYSADARNVKYVISQGALLVDNGTLTRENQAQLATRLSQIANDVDIRMINGKIWSENYVITKEDLAPSYWYKYRSIRKADTVNLTIQSSENINMCIATAGNVFGGGTATVINEAVNQRFPADKPAQSFSKSISLDSGVTLRITKNKSQNEWIIYQGGSIIFAKNSTSPGQLLVLALDRNSEFSTICRDLTF